MPRSHWCSATVFVLLADIDRTTAVMKSNVIELAQRQSGFLGLSVRYVVCFIQGISILNSHVVQVSSL